jgi:hypothetical protein
MCLSVWDPPPLLGFCFGWPNNFVGSESGQIQNVKLLQNMVSNRTQLPQHAVCAVYTVLLCYYTGKGGG